LIFGGEVEKHLIGFMNTSCLYRLQFIGAANTIIATASTAPHHYRILSIAH
jgi:hypothetical protein